MKARTCGRDWKPWASLYLNVIENEGGRSSLGMVNWQQKSFGYEALVGEGAFRLTIFYEHGWKVGINDRVVKHQCSDVETCKRSAINWCREKLKTVEAELNQLERQS